MPRWFLGPNRGRRLAAEGGRDPAQAPCLLPGPCSPVATRPPPCRVPGGHRAPPTPAQVVTPEFQGAPAAGHSHLKRLQFLFKQKGFLTAHSAPVSRLNERLSQCAGQPGMPGPADGSTESAVLAAPVGAGAGQDQGPDGPPPRGAHVVPSGDKFYSFTYELSTF